MSAAPPPWAAAGSPPQRHTLPNGLVCWLLPRPHLRAVELGLLVRDGPRFEDSRTSGIAHFTEHVIFRGSQTLGTFPLHRALERMGGPLDATTGRDNAAYTLTLPGDALEGALPLLSDLLLRPAFGGIEGERRVILDEARGEGDVDRALENASRQLLWPGSPLAQPIIGTIANIQRFSQEDLLAHHRRTLVTGNCRLYVAGGFEAQALIPLLERTFGQMSQGPALPLGAPPMEPTLGPRLRIIPGDDGGEAFMLSFPGPGFGDAAHGALPYIDALLADGMTSRLKWALTEEAALAYEVDAYLDPFVDCAALDITVEVGPGRMRRVLKETLSLLGALASGPPDADAFDFARDRLRTGRALAEDTPGALVAPLALADLFDATPPPPPSSPAALHRALVALFAPTRATLIATEPQGRRPHAQLQEILRAPWTTPPA